MRQVIGLHERIAALIKAPLTDLRVYRITYLSPPLDWNVNPVCLCVLDGPIKRHPRHDLCVGEMAARTPYFPQSLVWLLPVHLEKSEQHDQKAPNHRIGLQPSNSRQMQRIHDLSIDIELELS